MVECFQLHNNHKKSGFDGLWFIRRRHVFSQSEPPPQSGKLPFKPHTAYSHFLPPHFLRCPAEHPTPSFPPSWMGAGLGELLKISWLDVCNLALKGCWLAILITNVWVHKKTENNMADLCSHIPTIFILSTSCHIFSYF